MAMKYFEIFIEILIFISLMLFAVETVPSLSDKTREILKFSEFGIVIIFSIEYIIRVIHGKFKYVKSFFGIVDLVAIVPFFIFFIPQLSVIKILRILRMAKLIRYGMAFKSIGKAIWNVRKELLMYIVINFCLLYIMAVIMYYIEGPKQPDKFSSILASLWWAVVTLTSIGYGDIVPITPIGKFITGTISVLGLGVITIPTGLIVSSLVKTIKENKPIPPIDPHLESLPDRGFIDISEGNEEVDEKGKLRGIE